MEQWFVPTPGLRLYSYGFERPEEFNHMGFGLFWVYEHTLDGATKRMAQFVKDYNEAHETSIEVPKFVTRNKR